MWGTLEFAGYTFVKPHGELSRPLGEYFDVMAHTAVDGWVTLEEQEAKELIRIAHGRKSILSGGALDDVHELVPRGGAGAAAITPWNMVCVTREEHTQLHSGELRIERYDPLDRMHGLVVYHKSKRIPRRDLAFYSQPLAYVVRFAHESSQVISQAVAASTHNAWQVAGRLAWLYENDGHLQLDSDSFNALCSELGLSPTGANRWRRTFQKARESGVLDAAKRVPIARAAEVFRSVPEDQMLPVLLAAATQSGADFRESINQYKQQEPAKSSFVVINGDDIRLVRTDSYGGLKGVVVKGTVVKDVDGIVKEEL